MVKNNKAISFTICLGYGHITPQTQSGRMFLIIFALFGIPLNILALASVGEHITIAIFHFLRYISTRRDKKKRIKHINIKVMMVSIILMLCMLFIGGLLYCSTENWSYIDSIYYCFVAMATIGFGDLVPNKGRAPDSKEEKALWFLRALYLSIGLSLVSTVFTALSNAIEEINSLLAKHKKGKILFVIVKSILCFLLNSMTHNFNWYFTRFHVEDNDHLFHVYTLYKNTQ